MSTYTPIPCEFHDRLLHFATRREHVTITFRPVEIDAETHSAAGEGKPSDETVLSKGQAEQTTEGIILDVFTRSGAEYLLLHHGLQLRLDQVIRVQDFWLQSAAAC